MLKKYFKIDNKYLRKKSNIIIEDCLKFKDV